MFFDGAAERTGLHTRMDELERRLALLEGQIRGPGPEAAASTPAGPEAAASTPDEDRREASERRFGRPTTDRLITKSTSEDPDAGREGARLVALDMLEAGHGPEQVATYLRETFNLDEAGAALAVRGERPWTGGAIAGG